MRMFSNIAVCLLSLLIAVSVPAQEEGLTRRVYVSLGGENKLVWLALDENGKLKKEGAIETGAGPGPMALLAKQRLLYVGTRSDKGVRLYKLGSSGTPEFIASSPLIGNPVYVTVDPARKYLIAAHYGEGKVSTYALNANGVPSKEPTQVLDTLKNPHSVQVDASGSRVYVPNTGSDVIFDRGWNVEKGTLAPENGNDAKSQTGSGPRHFAFHPFLPEIYFVNEKDSTVGVYEKTGSSGKLVSLQVIGTLPQDFKGNNTCADIHVSPNGKYVYASNRGHNSIAVFRVDAGSGRLEMVETVPTEKIPRAFQIDPSGEFLVAAGQESGAIAAYKIDKATGKLTLTDTMTLGKSPSWVEITLGR